VHIIIYFNSSGLIIYNQNNFLEATSLKRILFSDDVFTGWTTCHSYDITAIECFLKKSLFK